MLSSTLLLSFAGLAIAAESQAVNFNGPKGGSSDVSKRNVFLRGTIPPGLTVRAANDGICDQVEATCDNLCIPDGGICCDTGYGAYCDQGYVCNADGCCPEGEVCDGPPSGCSDGKTLCNDFCVPDGSVCCSTGYCDAGETCTADGQCSTDSGDDSTTVCDASEEVCDTGCMPLGSVCCHDGTYCDADATCNGDGTCSDGSSESGSSGDDTAVFTTASETFAAETTDMVGMTTDMPESTSADGFFGSGGDGATDAVVETSSADSATVTVGSSPSGSSTDSGNAGVVNVPNTFFGLLGLIPLVL